MITVLLIAKKYEHTILMVISIATTFSLRDTAHGLSCLSFSTIVSKLHALALIDTVSNKRLSLTVVCACGLYHYMTAKWNLISPANYMSKASIDTYTIIGITIVISFVFFSLGVLVTTCVCFMVKRRSKVTLRHAALEPSVYEMINLIRRKPQQLIRRPTLHMEPQSRRKQCNAYVP